MKKQALVSLILLIQSSSLFGKVDSSSDIFFPKHQAQLFLSYQKAPITWWNFFIYNSEQVSKEQACEEVNQLSSEVLVFNPCLPLPFSPQWLSAWGQEQTLSQTPPRSEEELKARLNSALVQLSLPLPRDTLEVVKRSPLAQFEKITGEFLSFYQLDQEKQKWQVLPVLINFSVEDESQSSLWMEKLLEKESPHSFWVGPHIGSFVNKKQIIDDLKKVMLIASLLVLSLLIYLWATGKRVFLWLVPILVFSILGATAFIHLLWGAIHGLTLAFGSGLIGIAMDYAFHGWRKNPSPLVWRSNFISFLTTLSAFSLLYFFSTPLIQQLSLFALCGLSVAFILCYVTHKLLIQKIDLEEIPFKSKTSHSQLWLLSISLLMGLGGLGLFINDSDFSLKRMDFAQSMQPSVFQNTSFSTNKGNFGFSFFSEDSEDQVLSWAQQNKVSILAPGLLRGSLKTFKENLNLWKSQICSDKNYFSQLAQDQTYKNIFKDFFGFFNCSNLETLSKNNLWASSQLFSSDQQKIGIFKTQTEEQKQQVLENFPNTFFLSQLTEDFPSQLKSEVSRYFIFILFISIILLTVFFGNNAPLALLPALGSISAISSFYLIFGMAFSFISFIAMIILIGLTMDYGIFCSSYIKENEDLKRALGSIRLSCLTSLAGFAPLAFCSHPVLHDLGITIVIGLMGAALVTFKIYPMLEEKKRQRS